jgi:ATP-dependent Clp protease ATP-binding subunit ClpC
VKLAYRYVTDRKLPDKAIDLIDEAGAFCGISLDGKPEELLKVENEINHLEDKKNHLVKSQVYEKAAYIRDKIKELRGVYEQAKTQWLNANKKERIIIDQKEIELVLSSITNIPMNRLDDENNKKRYLNINEALKKTIKGQKEAIETVSNAIKKSIVGLKKIGKPISSLIFIGPTGVGKTALAKALAQFIFGSEEDLIKVDMSEYMEKFNVSKLVGAPPGYVGHESGGELTERIRRKPYSVILFDELEKAHPEVFNMLLQILDEGFITDSLGNKVDFRNSIIILTSNLGTDKLTNKGNLGFSDVTSSQEKNKEFLYSELKQYFKPEFLNRIDDIVIFKSLDESILIEIFDKMIEDLNENLSLKGIKFKISQDAKYLIISEGYESKYGARSLSRAISKYIEIPSTELLLKENINTDELKAPVEIKITLKNKKIALSISNKKIKNQETGAQTEEETVNQL